MTETLLYAISVIIVLSIVAVYLYISIKADIRCKADPNCYSTKYITYMEVLLIVLFSFIPVLNILNGLTVLILLLSNMLDKPIITGINKRRKY